MSTNNENNGKLAQELLRIILNADNYGVAELEKRPLRDVMIIVDKILPECMQTAVDRQSDNDVAYFADATRVLRAYAIDRLKKQENLYVAYSGLTGFPYYVDGCLVVFYDYDGKTGVEEILNKHGYEISVGEVTTQTFREEICHMYRNGYDTVIFADGTEIMYKVSREEIYAYDEFFTDEYILNPDFKSSMICFIQEARKSVEKDEKRMEVLSQREHKMFENMMNVELIVPCLKSESEDELEISFPFIDISADLKSDEPVVVIPVFTDGYEMNKCYGDHRDNMLYKFEDIIQTVEETGASGIMLNYAGEHLHLSLEVLKKVQADFVK